MHTIKKHNFYFFSSRQTFDDSICKQHEKMNANFPIFQLPISPISECILPHHPSPAALVSNFNIHISDFPSTFPPQPLIHQIKIPPNSHHRPAINTMPGLAPNVINVLQLGFAQR